MRIVCQQTILKKYHALFVILKKGQHLKSSSAAIIGGALWVKTNFINPENNYNNNVFFIYLFFIN